MTDRRATARRPDLPPRPDRSVAWWRLRVFAHSLFDRRAAAIWAIWLTLTLVSIGLAILEAQFDWSGIPLSVGDYTIGLSVYPPVAISALIAFGLGPAFGAVTAYASTLASGLTGGLDPGQAALFALGTPAGILLLWFMALMLRVRPHLPEYRDWWRFGAAALIAATASSLDIMLYNAWHDVALQEAQRLWQGWIFGDTALLCLVVAPTLRFTWRPVHDHVSTRIGAPHRDLSATNTVMLLAFVWATLSGLALVGLKLTLTALDIPENAITLGGELLVPRMREMETFLAVLVGVLLLSTIALTAELAATQENTLALSLRDDLTGAYNRRAFRRLFERVVERSRAPDDVMSLVYFDVDRFKPINDDHGHSVGDAVLIAVAREARAVLRPQDLLFRWGGDEFVVLLPHTGRDDASAMAARLRARVEAGVWMPGSPGAPSAQPVTISAGVATMHGRHIGMDPLVNAADAAVRVAKSLGRNRVATDVMTADTSADMSGGTVSPRSPQARGESA